MHSPRVSAPVAVSWRKVISVAINHRGMRDGAPEKEIEVERGCERRRWILPQENIPDAFPEYAAGIRAGCRSRVAAEIWRRPRSGGG